MLAVFALLLFVSPNCDDLLKPAAAALQQNQLAAAAAILNSVQPDCGRSAWYFELLGAKNDLSGDAAGAENALRKAVALDPKSSRLLSDLGILCLRNGKTQEGGAFLERSVALGATDSRVLFALGTLNAQKGSYDKAIAYLQRIPPSDADAAVAFNLGLAYSHQRQFSRARAAYFKAIDQQLEYPEAYLRVSLDFAATGETRKAVPWLYRAHEMAPDRVDVVVALSEQLLRLKYVKSAEDLVSQAILLNPRDNFLLVASGDIEQQKQNGDLAASKYKQALARQPDLIPAMVGLAQVALTAEKEDEAQMYLAQALAIDSSNPAANAAFGLVKNHKEEWASAEQHLKLAWSLDRSNPVDALELGRALRSLGRPAEALQILRSVMPSFSDSIPFHLELARIFSQLHKSAEAESERHIVAELQSRTQDTLRFQDAPVYVR